MGGIFLMVWLSTWLFSQSVWLCCAFGLGCLTFCILCGDQRALTVIEGPDVGHGDHAQ